MLYAVSGALWFRLAGKRWGVAGSAVLAAGLATLIVFNHQRPLIDVKYAKGSALKNEVFVKWNSFSRIALMARAPGIYSIEIDADSNTFISTYDFENLPEREARALVSNGSGMAYVLRPGARALIIGPGGGIDVARALASGSRDITGVEINPLIAETIMKQRFALLSKNLYLRPEVRIVVEDGRSFVRRSMERYQVLQATLVDTWASTAAGAFALTENNLYTVEAFDDYLSHLTDDGIVSFTRWGFNPPRESLRVVTLAREALKRMDEREFWRHIAVLREDAGGGPWGSLDTVLIARKPFPAADLATIKNSLAEAKLRALYLPGEAIPGAFTEMITSADPQRWERNYRFDVSAVSDDRPFFFYTVQPRDLLEFLRSYVQARLKRSADADYKVNIAIPVLFGLLAITIVATAVMVAIPRVLATKFPLARGVRRFLWYFLAIGAGYILIEVALIQRFVLFLGHPTHALTVIVFSLLVSSGIGSYYSRRVLEDSSERLSIHLFVVTLIAGLLAVFLAPLLEKGVGWPFWLKIGVSVLLIAPLGVALGMPFPTGLRRLEKLASSSIRWAWSLNAAASVLGSVGAILISIYLGLRATMLTGGLLYLGAILALRAAPRRGSPDDVVAQPL